MTEGQGLWQGLGDAVRQLRREAAEQLASARRAARAWFAGLIRRLP